RRVPLAPVWRGWNPDPGGRVVVIPGYREAWEIYRGGRYVVYRALRETDGTSVMVKAVRPDTGDQAGAGARLRREHALLRRLDLAGASLPSALAELAGQPALVLGDAGPQNLDEWLRGRPLDAGAGEFLDLAIPLTEVVARLHEREVLHRDLGPTNIVVSADGRLTLVDFDAAVIVPGLGRSGGVPPALEGALPYIAPEQTGRMN